MSTPVIPTRVVIADDRAILLEGLPLRLDSPQLRVVGTACSCREAVDLIRKLCPDILIIDGLMREGTGIDAAAKILRGKQSPRVIAIATQWTRELLLTSIQVGVAGHLVRGSAFEELKHAIDVVMRGHTYLSPPLVTEACALLRGTQYVAAGPRSRLNSSQQAVLRLIAEGLSFKEIASHLQVSVKSVAELRDQIKLALGVKTVAGLTKYALRTGLVPIDSVEDLR